MTNQCIEPARDGKPCKIKAGADGLCHIHRKIKEGSSPLEKGREAKRSYEQSPVAWSLNYRKVNGTPLDHRVQPYMLEPMEKSAVAFSNKGITVSILKGRQVGATTAAMSLGFWIMDMNGGEIIHAVPTMANAETVNEVLFSRLRETKWMNLKRGRSNATTKSFHGPSWSSTYYVSHTLGGNSTSAGDNFRGRTAVMAIYDERATMPPEAVAVIKSTLNTTPGPIIWNIGSAGSKGDALDLSFRNGSMAEWAIPCEFCSKHTVFTPYGTTEVEDLEKCIGQVDGEWAYVCEHCGRAINPSLGKWVHGAEAGKHVSYHVAAMNSVFYVAEKLYDDLTDPNQTAESLLREVCGIPFGGEGLTIEAQNIQIGKPTKVLSSVLGVDWGLAESFYVRLVSDGEKVVADKLGSVRGTPDQHVKELTKLVREWNPELVAADHGHSTGRNEKLNDATGRTWSVLSGRTPTPGGIMEQIRRERATRTYNVVKSWVWERIIEDLKAGTLMLGPGMEPLKQHILDVTPEKRGRNKDWVAYDTKRQHYASSLLYAYVVHLREYGRKKKSTVGYGNPLTTIR